MLSSFTRAAKLKRWLARPDCPQVLKECNNLFDKAFGVFTNTDLEEDLAESAFGPVPQALQSIVPD